MHTESKKTADGSATVYKLSLTEALNMLKATPWNNIPGSSQTTAFEAEHWLKCHWIVPLFL